MTTHLTTNINKFLAKSLLDQARQIEEFMDAFTEKLDFETYEALNEQVANCMAVMRLLSADNPLLEIQLFMEEAKHVLAMAQEAADQIKR